MSQEGAPSLRKRVTAELGCVTPFIVVPGQWSQGDMARQVDNIIAGDLDQGGIRGSSGFERSGGARAMNE